MYEIMCACSQLTIATNKDDEYKSNNIQMWVTPRSYGI